MALLSIEKLTDIIILITNNLQRCLFSCYHGLISGIPPQTKLRYISFVNKGKFPVLLLFLTGIMIPISGFSQECLSPIAEYQLPSPYSDDILRCVEVRGSYAYIVSNHFGLIVVDLHNYSSPAVIGCLNNPSSTDCGSYSETFTNIAIKDNMVYISYYCNLFRDAYTGVVAIDVSDPSNPIELGSISELLPIWYDELQISDHYLFATVHNAGGYYTLKTIDIADPSNMVIVNQIPDLGSVMTLSGALLVAQTIESSIKFYDVTDPVNPEMISLYEIEGVYDMEIENSYLYVSQRGGTVTIIDISDLSNPSYVNTITLKWFGANLSVMNNLLIVQDYQSSSYESDVCAFDVLNPYDPELINTIHQINYVGDLTTHNSIMMIVSTGTLLICDASDCQILTSFIPAGASKQGAKDTNWKTDLILHNPTDSSYPVSLTFLKIGQDNTSRNPVEVMLLPSSSIRYVDALSSLFGENNTAGGIRIESTQTTIVVSRTYNDQLEEGTYGQGIPTLSDGDAVTVLLPRRIAGLVQNDRYRSNLILLNISTSAADLNISLYDGTGAFIGSFPQHLLPMEYHQIDQIFSTYIDGPLEEGYLELSVTSFEAEVLALASVIDNISGDATTILSE